MDTDVSGKYLVVGCGYLGERVARRWVDAGFTVSALTRRAERAAQLQAQGIDAILGDVTDRSSLGGLPECDVVLFAVGFDRGGEESIEDVYVTGLANLVEALPAPPRRFIYISTTGVFGPGEGNWVDEDSPCAPARPGGKAHLAAEQRLAASPIADRSVILRCAGLYGPGRIPRLADVKDGRPIAANGDVYLNLIHIDDVAQVVCHVAQTKPPSRLYLLADGHPPLRREFYSELARLLDAPPPRFAPDEAASDSRRAGGDNKRISNRRMLDELHVELKYPSYRQGLAAIHTR